MNTKATMPISGHRAWRAWQFGWRHSRGAGGGWTDLLDGGLEPDDWKKNVVMGVVLGVVVAVLMFGFPAVAVKVGIFLVFLYVGLRVVNALLN